MSAPPPRRPRSPPPPCPPARRHPALVTAPPERLFARLHRALLDARTPPIAWDRLDPSALDDDAREEARRAWSARAAAEYHSMVVFAELLARLPEAGLPLALCTAATRLVQDEARHTELCAQLADALGGSHDAPLDRRALRVFSPALDARMFVARWTLSMMCVGESGSLALLDALHSAATDPCVRAVLRVLRRDEALHDRFGWALARAILPALSEAQREWLAGDLAIALAHYERVNAGALHRDQTTPEGAVAALATPEAPRGANLGVLALPHFARAFYTHLSGVIVPGLEALGLPAREAFAHRWDATTA